jgi:2-phospho-L-lactate guanylyltransferase
MPSSPDPGPWTVIVPVKQITFAKSRLTGMDEAARRALAIAFARDTVTAAVASPMVGKVVVVSNDKAAADIAAIGATLLPDIPDAGLNPALEYAAARIRSERAGAPVAAISSDLPALRGQDLTHALALGPDASPWFVADAQGVGTTMLASPADCAWTPRFGAQSRAAHRALGIVEVDALDIERLRRDVDTVDDLSVAQRLGVGPNTEGVLADLQTRRLA